MFGARHARRKITMLAATCAILAGALLAGGERAVAQEATDGRPLIVAQGRLRPWEQEDYIVQTEWALANLDSQMARLAWRAARDEAPGRCSFSEAKQAYEARSGTLRAMLRRSRDGSSNAPGRGAIESALQEAKAAFERALSCYQ